MLKVTLRLHIHFYLKALDLKNVFENERMINMFILVYALLLNDHCYALKETESKAVGVKQPSLLLIWAWEDVCVC